MYAPFKNKGAGVWSTGNYFKQNLLILFIRRQSTSQIPNIALRNLNSDFVGLALPEFVMALDPLESQAKEGGIVNISGLAFDGRSGIP